MAPSFDCSAASLLCREDASGCFSYEGEQESAGGFHDFEVEDAMDAVAALIEREIFHVPQSDYVQKCQSDVLLGGCRKQAISWLFKTRGFYNFDLLTAGLAVNYLDRFLSQGKLPVGKAWMVQLLSVACLSLAAKIEEVEVPLLLDLQVEPQWLFEPYTIQRMELLVLNTLQWRMRSVTPFSYIGYFLSNLDFGGSSHRIVLSRINELVLSAIQELRFLCYRPVFIAAAAVLCALQDFLPLKLANFKKTLLCMLPEDMQNPLERCFALMLEMFLGASTSSSKDEICAGSVPRSPAGVLEASFSCDSESTIKSMGPDAGAQVSLPPVPKKRKLDDLCSSMNACAS